MRSVTGLLLGAVTSAALGSSQLIQNTHEGSLPSFTWPVHDAAQNPGAPIQGRMEVPEIQRANSEAISGGDVISGVISASGDSSSSIAILTGDDLRYETARFSYKLYALTAPGDELTGPVGASFTQGGEDVFRFNDLAALTRDYERFSQRNTVGDDGDGNVTFDQLMPAGGRYGESVPPQSFLADYAAEPVGEAAGSLVKWVGGTLLMILIILAGIGIRERKSHEI